MQKKQKNLIHARKSLCRNVNGKHFHEKTLDLLFLFVISCNFLCKTNYQLINTDIMQNIDWANLTFGYYPTNYNVRCYYRNGQWGEIEVSSETTINIHMAATCLHYGQEAFEGMKAFRGKDGKVRIFRMDENGKRL